VLLRRGVSAAAYKSMKIRLRTSIFLVDLGPLSPGRNIPFVNHVKYLGAIFDGRITWRLHIEMVRGQGVQNIY
jgi:hypothetical protein